MVLINTFLRIVSVEQSILLTILITLQPTNAASKGLSHACEEKFVLNDAFCLDETLLSGVSEMRAHDSAFGTLLGGDMIY